MTTKHPSPLLDDPYATYADDIDLTGGSSSELRDLTNRLVDRATAYRMEVSTEKNKIMTNSKNNISIVISMNSQ